MSQKGFIESRNLQLLMVKYSSTYYELSENGKNTEQQIDGNSNQSC